MSSRVRRQNDDSKGERRRKTERRGKKKRKNQRVAIASIDCSRSPLSTSSSSSFFSQKFSTTTTAEALVRLLHPQPPTTTTPGASSAYRVLILDAFTKDVVAPLLRVGDLRRHGVSLHLQLRSAPRPDPGRAGRLLRLRRGRRRRGGSLFFLFAGVVPFSLGRRRHRGGCRQGPLLQDAPELLWRAGGGRAQEARRRRRRRRRERPSPRLRRRTAPPQRRPLPGPCPPPSTASAASSTSTSPSSPSSPGSSLCGSGGATCRSTTPGRRPRPSRPPCPRWRRGCSPRWRLWGSCR